MRSSTWLSSLFMAGVASIAAAAPDFQITELWTGLSGEDGTADWIEVTNLGDMDGDTSTLWYDDGSEPTIGTGGQLDSFLLGPGESAVFLTESAPSDDVTYTSAIEEFVAIWSAGINVGLTNGGGNLGQGGDTANLLLADGTIIESLGYSASGDTATFEDPTGAGIEDVLSVLGVNGAFESAAFFNDNITLPPETTVTIVGSPGVAVPEPAAAALVALALTAAAARRQRD